LILYTNFPSTAAAIASEPSVVDLQIKLTCSASQNICCAICDSFLTPVTGTYKLVALITQDSIVSWQVDADANPTNIQYYVFNHVLRDVITPNGDVTLVNGSAAAGLKQIRHFDYTIPASYSAPVTNSVAIPCIANNCHIVAFIYNTSTHEIIQSAIANVVIP
jgi:hypothetical protein